MRAGPSPDAQHFEQAFRRFFLQALEQFGAVRLREIPQHHQRFVAQRLDERPSCRRRTGRGGQYRQYLAQRRIREATHDPRGRLHATHARLVGVVQFQQGGDAGEDVGGGPAVHPAI